MKIYILFLYLIISNNLIDQRIDKVIDKQIYTSYFSYSLKGPLFVVYDLYNGGGDNSRKNLRFKEEFDTAKNKDFAYNSDFEKLTFSLYNIFPQDSKLNRGVWKTWETTIRNESKKWPLRIYVGAIYGTRKIKGKIAIPEYCWKVVINKKT